MAVVVQCFHCNAILELDDGFRGGVCRCGTCASLLQVPKGDSAGMPARPPRPAGPPAPVKAGTALRTGTANADTGISSGRLNPTSDTGGISSGLGRVHQTTPITHISRKSSKRAKEPIKVESPQRPAAAEPAATPTESTSPLANSASGQPKSTSPHTPAWLATLLLLATAAVVAAIVYVYIFKK